MLNRNLCGATKIPLFQSALNNDNKDEYASDYLDKQLKRSEFDNLQKDEQILKLINLILEKDIRTALKLALNTDLVRRYEEIECIGLTLKEEMFISCTDIYQKGAFFGQIQTLFSFDFPQLQLPYIKIQLLFDIETLKAQQFKFQEKDLYINGKKIDFYGQVELVLTNQFTFIQLEQIASIIQMETPQQYALIENNLKGPQVYFNRFYYNFDTQILELLNKKVEICDKCQLLLNPQLQQRIKFCIGCQNKFIHENCSTEFLEGFKSWSFCSDCNAAKDFNKILEKMNEDKIKGSDLSQEKKGSNQKKF